MKVFTDKICACLRPWRYITKLTFYKIRCSCQFTCHFPHLREEGESTHSCSTVVNSGRHHNFCQYRCQNPIFIARRNAVSYISIIFFRLVQQKNIGFLTFSHCDAIPCPTDVCVWIFSIHRASDVEPQAIFDLLPHRVHHDTLRQPFK